MQLFQLLNFIFPRDRDDDDIDDIQPESHERGYHISKRNFTFSTKLRWRTDQGRKVKSR